MKDLKSELGGNLEEVVLALMEPCELFDARSLRSAMKVYKLCNSLLLLNSLLAYYREQVPMRRSLLKCCALVPMQ